MKLKNRILSGLLTGCLMLSLVPMTAGAIGKTAEGMQYSITDEGTVTITGMDEGYTGALTVPDTIEGKPVTAIGEYAFNSCSGLTAISVPASVTNIADSAFGNCSSLEAFTFPEGVERIGEYSFYGCTSLTEVTIPDSVKSIGQYAFFNCGSLSAVTIPDSVTEIGEYAFCCCNRLDVVKISGGLTRLTKYAFAYDTYMGTLYIPKSVTAIDGGAFDDCHCLTDVYYAGSEAEWNQISIAADNDYVTAANIHYNWSDPDTPAAPAVTDIFTDVTPSEWYVPYIQTAVDNQFMSGTSATTFEPNGTATRAMFVQILYAMAGKPDVSGLTCPFTDVTAGEWYYNAVVWAYNNNVTSGTSDTTFGTNDAITREQIALLLYAYMGKPEVSGELTGFADTASVDSWAYTGLLWANRNEIIKGSNEGGKLCLNPLKNASRAEIATMMSAFYKLTQEEPDEGAPVLPEGCRIAEEEISYFGGLYESAEGLQLDVHMYTYYDGPYAGTLNLLDQNGNTLYKGEFQMYQTNFYGLANDDLTMTVYTDNGSWLDVYENGKHLGYFNMTIPYAS